ncbi:MAG: replication-relaxation family protein, partial [Candidatus Acidiferrales bacterium]
MNVRLTDRDVRMLVKCAVCRWLMTAQIHKLYFPDATLNAVQKRLRKLSDAGYLRSYREHPTAEAVHAIGPKGKPVVEEKGIEAALGEEVPRQLEHLMGVNQIRIAVETSAVH